MTAPTLRKPTRAAVEAPGYSVAACPIGCGRDTAFGSLLCDTCADKLPAHLRERLRRTWDAWRRDWGRVASMQAYRDAARAAVWHIERHG